MYAKKLGACCGPHLWADEHKERAGGESLANVLVLHQGQAARPYPDEAGEGHTLGLLEGTSEAQCASEPGAYPGSNGARETQGAYLPVFLCAVNQVAHPGSLG